MHMSRRHLLAVERQWQGRAGIVRHSHLIAQIGCSPGGGVNAHVAHAADDGQRLDAMPKPDPVLLVVWMAPVGGLDTPDGHFVIQAHGNKGWIASSQLLFKADTSVSDAIHPADVDPNYTHPAHVH